MAEEVKKAKKPRSTKKTGAGTELTVDKQAKKKEAVAPETTEKKAPAAKKSKAKKPAVKKAEAETLALDVVSVDAVAVDAEPSEAIVKGDAPSSKKDEAKTESAVKKPRAKRTVKQLPKTDEEVKEAEAFEESKAVKEEEKAVEIIPVEAETETVLNSEKEEEMPLLSQEESAEKAPAKQKTKKAKVDKKEKTEKPAPTKAEKKDFVKKLARETLVKECKWSELIDRVAQGYKEAYPIPENDNLNDVKGRVGSVIHVMQEDGEIVVEGNLVKMSPADQKEEKGPTVSAVNEEIKTDETLAVAMEEASVKAQEITPAVVELAGESARKEPGDALVEMQAETPAPLYDLSLLFDTKKSAKKTGQSISKTVETIVGEKTDEIKNTKQPNEENGKKSLPKKSLEEKVVKKTLEKAEEKPSKELETPLEKSEKVEKTAEKNSEKQQGRKIVPTRRPMRSVKTDPLKDAFLKRLRSLGGNYFEYYAIYLLERYSRMNGRRLEGLRISGGEYDGGIDGELELTDRLGFRETIYVQAKNWEPTDERWWIGETILQQFIGAVIYRQAKEGKQHCRGMLITTSAFTMGAKEMLEKLSDKFVGYDGDDLYETAKECQFGLIKDEKGNWKVDDELLSGKKSFFFML